MFFLQGKWIFSCFCLINCSIPVNPNSTAFNLSTVYSDGDEIKVLFKDSNYCPTPSDIDNMKLTVEMNNLSITLRIKE